jgi:ribosomal protein S18 acetylase RimI-like enzyme
MSMDLTLLRRLEQSLKNAAAKTRQHRSFETFEVFFSDSPEAVLSFALPREALQPTSIALLKETFAARGRVARLEYFHELYPDLQQVLQQNGFAVQMVAPVMTLEPKDLAQPSPVSASYQRLSNETAMLETFLRSQSLAYKDDWDNALAWLPSMLEGLGNGSLMGAQLEQDSKAISGAVIQGAQDGELAGVWTLPEKQQQGFSFALCSRLLADYFATGQTLCWLSATEGALRLYEKLGFKRVGTQINAQAG